MHVLILISYGELEEEMYNIIWGILQVLGILLGGCL